MRKLSPTTLNKILLITTAVFLFSIVVFSAASSAHALDPVYKVLTPTADCTATADAIRPAEHCFAGMGQVTARIWYDIMAVVDSLVLAALIWVAFMNILRVQLDSYAVKKILPTFIMAIVLANFSFLISRMLLDLANIAISAFLTGNKGSGVTAAFDGLINAQLYGPNGAAPAGITNYAGYIAVYIVKQLFLGVAAVMVAILAFIFLIRNYFLYFLVCIAPAAFMALILPLTKKYFQQWWSQFLKWAFMPVVAVFWLWLAGEFVNNDSLQSTWILPVALGGLCLYMAITSPFKVGGAAVGAWQNWGKKAWGQTGGQAVKGGKWVANGGLASWRTYVNQQKAVQAEAYGDKEAAKRYNAAANRWTKANPRAWREGIKSRITTGAANATKAPYKTPWYNTLAGRAASIDAIYQASFESDRNLTPTEAGRKAGDKLRSAMQEFDQQYIQQMQLESRKAERQIERDKLGFANTEAGLNAYMDHLILADFDDKNAAKLSVIHPKAGAKALGDLKSAADAYMKNQKRTNTRVETIDGLAVGAGFAQGAFSRRQTPPAATAAQNPAVGGGGAAGAPAGTANPSSAVPLADMTHIEQKLEEIRQAITGGPSNLNPDTMAAKLSQAVSAIKTGGVGVGGVIGAPEIRIAGLTPQARSELGLVQDAANRRAQTVRQRIETRENDQILQALRNIADHGTPQRIEQLADQGNRQLEIGGQNELR